MPKVKLITHTPEPEKVVAAAAKLCYSNSEVDKLMDGLTEDKVTAFLNKLTNLGHQSPLEHVSFTFSIEGVSRAFLAQITRHRMASFSVRSQRYCSMSEADFVVPEGLEHTAAATAMENSYRASKCAYNAIKDTLTQEYIRYGITPAKAVKKAQENARYVLPEATTTAMIVTMNARELLHFFELRCCNRAQDEIKEVADMMLAECYQVAPHLFREAGPACTHGGCSEGGMSCGRLNETKDKYAKLKGLK